MLNKLKRHIKDPLYKNSIFLILTNFVGSILGFVYWVFAARLYSAKDVGLATAIISAMTLLVCFSRIGLGVGLIRFLPQEKRKGEIVNSCLTLVAILSLFLSTIFILSVDFWTPTLKFLKDSTILIVLFITFTMLSLIADIQRSTFVALRRAELTFVHNMIWMGLKSVLIVFFTTLGFLGIYISWGLSVCISVFFGFFVLMRCITSYHPKLMIKFEIIKELLHFSLGNYIAVIFQTLPQMVLPLMILNVLGAEMVAYFYMAWMVAFLLFSISSSVGFSLIAECSHNQNQLKHVITKSIKFIFIILIPSIFIIFLFGKGILTIFGKNYSENAFSLLKILAISSIPVAFVTIYVDMRRVEKKIKDIIFIYGFIAIFTLGLGYLLMLKIGLIGIGIAWLLANTILLIVIVFFKFLF